MFWNGPIRRGHMAPYLFPYLFFFSFISLSFPLLFSSFSVRSIRSHFSQSLLGQSGHCFLFFSFFLLSSPMAHHRKTTMLVPKSDTRWLICFPALANSFTRCLCLKQDAGEPLIAGQSHWSTELHSVKSFNFGYHFQQTWYLGAHLPVHFPRVPTLLTKSERSSASLHAIQGLQGGWRAEPKYVIHSSKASKQGIYCICFGKV